MSIVAVVLVLAVLACLLLCRTASNGAGQGSRFKSTPNNNKGSSISHINALFEDHFELYSKGKAVAHFGRKRF
jgi:hypothetical protein